MGLVTFRRVLLGVGLNVALHILCRPQQIVNIGMLTAIPFFVTWFFSSKELTLGQCYLPSESLAKIIHALSITFNINRLLSTDRPLNIGYSFNTTRLIGFWKKTGLLNGPPEKLIKVRGNRRQLGRSHPVDHKIQGNSQIYLRKATALT